MDREYDYLFKFVVIGDSGCGKSSILRRFVDHTFYANGTLPTIGVDFFCRTFFVGDQKVKVQCWDTAGQERFRAVASSYYRGAHAVILVYDITDRDSLAHLQNWWEILLQHRNADAPVSIGVVGNKCDLDHRRQVTPQEGRAWIEARYTHDWLCRGEENATFHIPETQFYFNEISAKTNPEDGIEKLFAELTTRLIAAYRQLIDDKRERRAPHGGNWVALPISVDSDVFRPQPHDAQKTGGHDDRKKCQCGT